MKLFTDSWLSPKGQIIKVGSFQHNNYAEKYLKKLLGHEKFRELCYGSNKYPYEILHEKGWVRIKSRVNGLEIIGGCIDLTKPMKNTIDPPMNQKQLKVAKKLCEEYGITLHVAINDKRFW